MVPSIIQAFELKKGSYRDGLDMYTLPDCFLMPNNNFGNTMTAALASSNISMFKQVCKNLDGREPDFMSTY